MEVFWSTYSSMFDISRNFSVVMNEYYQMNVSGNYGLGTVLLSVGLMFVIKLFLIYIGTNFLELRLGILNVILGNIKGVN